MTATDIIQASAMVLLVIVTAYYAIRTHIMSKAADTQVKIMEDTIDKSMHPYISFEKKKITNQNGSTTFDSPTPPSVIQLTASNAGNGPAINIYIQCLPISEYKAFAKKHVPHTDCYGTQMLSMIKTGEMANIEFNLDPNGDPELVSDPSLLIIAFYEDIFRQYWETIHTIVFEENSWIMGKITQKSSSQDTRITA